MSNTVRHALPFLEAGQAQKEVTHNEALLKIDRLLHIAVLSRVLSAPPVSATEGQAWIVGPAASGEWMGHDHTLAVREGSGWAFVLPAKGMLVWIEDEGLVSVWDDSWSTGWPASGLSLSARPVITLPVGGGVVDVELRQRFAELVAGLRAIGLAD